MMTKTQAETAAYVCQQRVEELEAEVARLQAENTRLSTRNRIASGMLKEAVTLEFWQVREHANKARKVLRGDRG
jgi:hypothetical protein